MTRALMMFILLFYSTAAAQVVVRPARSLVPGERLEVVVVDAPGCQASFEVRGVVDPIPMRETTSGHYEGHMSILPTMRADHAAIVVHLKQGGKERLLEASESLTVALVKAHLSPEAGSTVASPRPTVAAEVPNLRPETVRLEVDKLDITAQAHLLLGSVRWTAPSDLQSGPHTASLTGYDSAGTPVSQHWSFQISPTPPPQIESVSVSPPGPFRPGDGFTVTVRGPAGATGASLDIGRNSGIALAPIGPGIYSARYLVARNDMATLPISATLQMPDGSQLRKAGPSVQRLALPSFFMVDNLTDGSVVDSTFDVQGQADPGARIELEVKSPTSSGRTSSSYTSSFANDLGRFNARVHVGAAPTGARLVLLVKETRNHRTVQIQLMHR